MTDLAKTVSKALTGVVRKEQPRLYLGMSEIGDPCPRKLWYKFRWATDPKIPARIYRLFARGHAEEERLIALLREAGFSITGQQRQVSDLYSHFQGHIDGIIENKAVLEVKTHSLKYFKQLTNIRNIRKCFPKYYTQVQLYMHYLKLRTALHCNICKDNDAIYFENIKRNSNEQQRVIGIAKDIIFSDTALPKYPGYYCNFCDFAGVCAGKLPMQANCRTCKFSTVKKKHWICRKKDKILKPKKQRKGCGKWASK